MDSTFQYHFVLMNFWAAQLLSSVLLVRCMMNGQKALVARENVESVRTQILFVVIVLRT